MRVTEYTNARDFLYDVASFLERNEVVNNLPLGILFKINDNTGADEDENKPFFASVKNSNNIYCVMMMTPPHHLILCGVEHNLNDSMQAAVEYLTGKNFRIPGVIGPNDIAPNFSTLWSQETKCRAVKKMAQMIYGLEKTEEMKFSPGHLIFAGADHIEIVTEWVIDFSKATPHSMNRDEARRRTEHNLRNSTVFLWKDKTPVSMALKTRPTGNVVCISGVYTPPPFRNKGYATSCVSAVSRYLLQQGFRSVALYADSANPVSNSIYRKIGFRPVSSSVIYDFIHKSRHE